MNLPASDRLTGHRMQHEQNRPKRDKAPPDNDPPDDQPNPTAHSEP